MLLVFVAPSVVLVGLRIESLLGRPNPWLDRSETVDSVLLFLMILILSFDSVGEDIGPHDQRLADMGEVGIQNELLERFCRFFLVEQRIRAKAYLMSVGITLAYSLVAVLLLHISDKSVAIQATCLLCALVGTFVVRYVALDRLPDRDVRHEVQTFHPWLERPRLFGCNGVSARSGYNAIQYSSEIAGTFGQL